MPTNHITLFYSSLCVSLPALGLWWRPAEQPSERDHHRAGRQRQHSHVSQRLLQRQLVHWHDAWRNSPTGKTCPASEASDLDLIWCWTCGTNAVCFCMCLCMYVSVCIGGCDSLQLSAVDADAGRNGEVTYRILAGDQGHFVIGNR